MSQTQTANHTSLETKVDEIKDMELVNRLDIINLKNEIDQLKVTLPQSIDRIPKDELTELVKIAEKIKDVKQLKRDIDEISSMKHDAEAQPEELRQIKDDLDELKHRFGFHHGNSLGEQHVCSHCGADLPAVAKFCKQCGSKA